MAPLAISLIVNSKGAWALVRWAKIAQNRPLKWVLGSKLSKKVFFVRKTKSFVPNFFWKIKLQICSSHITTSIALG
jgi:hypothetical protein